MTPPDRPATSPSPTLLGAVLVVVAACVPYLSTIHGYFLQEDFGNIQLFANRPWSTFPRWFTMPWSEDIWGFVPDEIRPFTALAFKMTTVFGATQTEAGHLMNLALHAGNALLVLGMARTVARLSPIAATFTALVFAVLPVQAESVAWLTGRVDSLPAFFYLATFLAYVRWRTAGGTSPRAYASALVLFFIALFTKQTTITMVASLALYDWLIADRPPRLSWTWIAPYVPFAAMTVAYLALRYFVVGTVIRENRLSLQGLVFFGELFARHLRHVVTGVPGSLSALAVAGAVLLMIALAVAACAHGSTHRRRVARVALCLGPLWWLIGIAPVLVAGYDSPRHVYVASVGWAMLLGIGLAETTRAHLRRVVRLTATVAAAAIVTVYLARLRPVVGEWNTASAISKEAAGRLKAEALAAPPDSLVIIGVPPRIWEWALPFVAQPPFARVDLHASVRILTPQRMQCCQAPWFDETKRMLRQWLALPSRPPVIALYVDPRTGGIARLTDSENPELRALIPALLDTDSPGTLDQALRDMLRKLVGGR